MPHKTIPIYARVDIRKYVAIASWLKRNGLPNVSGSKSRIIAETINLLHTILQQDESFEAIDDIEEALIILDNWGIGFTDSRAKKAAVKAIHFSDNLDLSKLVRSDDDQEVDEAVNARIQELFKPKNKELDS